MAYAKLLNLFALSSLAVLVCSFSASPVSALSLASQDHQMAARRGHGAIAKKRASGAGGKKKRSTTGRCKPKTTTSSKATSTTPKATPAATTKANTAAKSTPVQNVEPAPTTKAAAPPASTPIVNSGTGKVGFGGLDPSTLANFVTKNTKFWFNWGPDCPNDQLKPFGIECMPMLWSDASDKVSAFQQAVVPGYATNILGFNECNEPGQSNMSPEDAASAWKKYIEPKKDEGFTLWGPSMSSNPNGVAWYKSFLQACNGGCTLHGIQIHYYDITAQGMIDYLNLWHSTFGLPLLVTEFACQNFNTANENNGQQCSESQIQSFYSGAVEFMQNSDFVVGFFAFGFFDNLQGVNQLDQLSSGGKPTSLGSKIINLSF